MASRSSLSADEIVYLMGTNNAVHHLCSSCVLTQPPTGPAGTPDLVSMVQQLNGSAVAPLSADAASVLQIVTADLLQDVTSGTIDIRQLPVQAPLACLFCCRHRHQNLHVMAKCSRCGWVRLYHRL